MKMEGCIIKFIKFLERRYIVLNPEKRLSREYILEQVKEVVKLTLQGLSVKVYLFGSWARKEERTSSDIDIAIWYDETLPLGTFAKLRLALEESLVPYHVDIVDLVKADSIIVKKVQKEGVLWKDCSKE